MDGWHRFIANMIPANFSAPYCQQEFKLQEEQLEQFVNNAVQSVQNIKQERERLITSSSTKDEDKVRKANLLVFESKLWQEFLNATEAVSKTFPVIKSQLNEQKNLLNDKLVKWKHEKRNGSKSETLQKDSKILEWFKRLEKFVYATTEQVRYYVMVIKDLGKIDPQFERECAKITNKCKVFMGEIEDFISSIVMSGIIIRKQPPPIVRHSEKLEARPGTNSKMLFDMEAWFCAGEKFGIIGSEVELKLITSKVAKNVNTGTIDALSQNVTSAGSISWSPVCIDVSDDSCMSARINSIRVQQAKKIKEPDQEDTSGMYHILFRIKKQQTEDGSVQFHPFWVISLPFSIVTNATRQAQYKQAQMFWHRAFLIDDETSLSVENNVLIKWTSLFPAFNEWFKEAVNEASGKHLRKGLEEHELFIRGKILEASNNNDQIDWETFYEKKIPSIKKSFWSWMFLIYEYVSSAPRYWDSDLIHGFGTPESVAQMLQIAKEPSIVFTFSDTDPGKIVGTYNDCGPQKKIVKIPFDDPVFSQKTLAQRVRLCSLLNCETKILPSQRSIRELYALEPEEPPKPPIRPDGCVQPRLVVVWENEPNPPIYQNAEPVIMEQIENLNENKIQWLNLNTASPEFAFLDAINDGGELTPNWLAQLQQQLQQIPHPTAVLQGFGEHEDDQEPDPMDLTI